MKTPKNAASDTLIRRVRGAGPDGRARTEGKDKSVPVPPRHGSFRGEDAGTPHCATSPQTIDLHRDIRTREGRSPMTELTPLAEDLLVMLHGQLDALFTPFNCGLNTRADQARWQRRDKYIGSKSFPCPGLLPWSNPGEEGAEKKRWSRARNVLEALGFARTSGKEAGLTELGLVAARALCGHIQLTDCLVGLDFFLPKLGTDHEWLDIGSQGIIREGWLSECTLAGFDPFPPAEDGKTRLPLHPWIDFRDALIPLCIADLLTFNFKPDFELPLYHLTEKGRSLAEERRDAGTADPDAWLKLPTEKAIEKETPDAWSAAWEKTIAELDHARPLGEHVLRRGLSGRLWPDAVLPEADRHFKGKRKKA